MNAHDYIALASVVLLILLNGFFTLAKTALATVSHMRLQYLVTERAADAPAQNLQVFSRDPARVFATAQVGITLASFGVAAIIAGVVSPDVSDWLRHRGWAHDITWTTVILTLAAAFVAITVGELVPYAYAQRYPMRAATLAAAPLRLFMVMFSFLATIALGLSNLIVKPFGLTATFATPMVTEQELQTLLDAGAQAGTIEEGEKEIIENVISFGDTDVRQVMTPRIDIKAADITIGCPALIQLIISSGHTRIPVYESNIDNIVGIIHAKDLLPYLAQGRRDVVLRSVARTPLIVPENKRVDELLEEFRRSNIQLAIVQDEYGGTAGLVTIEDLLEELVGEIKDEYDVEIPMVRSVEEGVAILDGRMALDDVNEELNLELPTDDFDTLGGFVFGLFGHQPVEGETVVDGDWEFTVKRTDGRRIQEVKIAPYAAPAEGSEGSEENGAAKSSDTSSRA
ncbi:gliding motility protein GldE [Capsulimonas corticalis]|uniref:Gliding motility protein GldE n=1 Tax=Capsulimonas corticalis TaxID=2219043 RepID=A0A402CXV1_9BACT|nr:hemolysin family protein [Capsulimonas corticalis]BDI32174.1 gliding motility protein GldE [Capsulimonas corticalis]